MQRLEPAASQTTRARLPKSVPGGSARAVTAHSSRLTRVAACACRRPRSTSVRRRAKTTHGVTALRAVRRRRWRCRRHDRRRRGQWSRWRRGRRRRFRRLPARALRLQQGDIIDGNICLPGYLKGRRAGHGLHQRTAAIRDGSRGIDALVIMVSAGWCGVCKAQNKAIPWYVDGSGSPQNGTAGALQESRSSFSNR